MQEINNYIMMLEDKLRDKDIVQYYKRNSEIKVNENLIINKTISMCFLNNTQIKTLDDALKTDKAATFKYVLKRNLDTILNMY